MEELKFIVKYIAFGVTLITAGYILTNYIQIKYFNK